MRFSKSARPAEVFHTYAHPDVLTSRSRVSGRLIYRNGMRVPKTLSLRRPTALKTQQESGWIPKNALAIAAAQMRQKCVAASGPVA